MTVVLEGLAVDVLASVSRKYSSSPMITDEMDTEGYVSFLLFLLFGGFNHLPSLATGIVTSPSIIF